MEITAVLCSFLENLTFSIHCVIFLLLDYRKCMEELRFSKKQQRTAMPPDLVCTFFKFIGYIFQRKSDKYIQLARISWLCIPIQTFDFPSILSWLPIMPLQPWRDLFSDCLNQRWRMLWLSRLAVDPVGRAKVYSVYMEKNLAALGVWPYHQKGVTRLGGSPF